MSEASSHAQRVCRYAAEQLANGRNGGTVIVDAYPDEEERRRPAIDLLAHDSRGPISVEHTLIEPYAAQLHDNKRVVEVFEGFPERFGHALASPGRYTLGIHTRGGHVFPVVTRPRLSIDWRTGSALSTCPCRKFPRGPRITSWGSHPMFRSP